MTHRIWQAILAISSTSSCPVASILLIAWICRLSLGHRRSELQEAGVKVDLSLRQEVGVGRDDDSTPISP
jgi:hypothetical protein